MNRIAKFELVSREQFVESMYEFYETNSFISDFLNDYIHNTYDALKLPQRATNGSAGYDFYTPVPIYLKSGQSVKIPTGIRVKIDDGWCLAIIPRSGLGTKYRLQLDNTVGLIDSDYYNAKNEGHIFIKVTNDSKEDKTISVDAFDRFAQGVFLIHGITVDDECEEERTGGFGSTG